jgi:hypothetical protein
VCVRVRLSAQHRWRYTEGAPDHFRPSVRRAIWRITWLPHDVLAKLRHLRGPGESYSDVILRIAASHFEATINVET